MTESKGTMTIQGSKTKLARVETGIETNPAIDHGAGENRLEIQETAHVTDLLKAQKEKKNL